ncbi:MAG TPA: DNA mismatch repair endonuclease MutL [Saprospiraceae bacterium]|nr:DNA mismatch repair endonuclease MutL [Saprospiraceae bacterium]
MTDIIQSLPDAIANQIAAGEVIQRPASVVKELLENSIDAGSSEIKLIVKDAGKTLIQVIDNGCGMSETDARMSFERHATSKIRKAEDLFAIRTMGFRGEAMASIGAVAQVEMRTRRQMDELGTKIILEDSQVKSQEACQCSAGTNLSVKNLFYNIPARRNFLKSNTVEMRHILDEFQRVAIAHPDIFFSLHHNKSEVFHLPAGNLRQRLVAILGNSCNKKLVPIEEETDALKLYGYVGKPEFARKTRGEQYFFVNNRFIKSAYLNHAVVGAYEELLPKDSYPLYVIFIEIDPVKIDINVHPTKQEIKFDDERLVYNYLKVAVRHALGQHNIIPTLDFEQEVSLSRYGRNTDQRITPVERRETVRTNKEKSERETNNAQNWQKVYDGLEEFDDMNIEAKNTWEQNGESLTIESEWTTEASEMDDSAKTFSEQRRAAYQIHSTYIVSQIKSGFLLIDQQAAHERILYERYLEMLEQKENIIQKELFPKTINISPIDAATLREILPQINQLGFDIKDFGQDAFIIQGVPADLKNGKGDQEIIENLIEQYKKNVALDLGIKENIARSMARSAAIKRGQYLSNEEMQELIDKLFACEVPFKSPTGRNCFITFDLDDLQKKFKA